MRSEQEAEEEEDWGLPLEMSPQLEGSRWSLFFRLARKRADYFSDIEELLHTPDIDQLPTRDSSAFRRAIEAILTQPEGLLSITEQPTRLAWIVERPTQPLPDPSVPPARVRPAPTLLFRAVGTREEHLADRKSGLPRGARGRALAWCSRLFARGTLWRPRRLRKRAHAEQLNSSLR